jgi:hypothetical protein
VSSNTSNFHERLRRVKRGFLVRMQHPCGASPRRLIKAIVHVKYIKDVTRHKGSLLSVTVHLFLSLAFFYTTLIFHSSRDSYLAHHPSANFPSANFPSGEREKERERERESGGGSDVRAFLVDVFLSTPGRRDGGRAVAVYLSVIRERELDRVLESFASLIESR